MGKAGTGRPLVQRQYDQVATFQHANEEVSIAIGKANSFSQNIGNVLATSGIRINPKHECLHDWALISLDTARFKQ